MLRVDRGCLPLGDPEELGIEARYIVEEPAPSRHRPTRHTGFGVVVLVSVPAVGGNLGDQVVAAQQRLPQQVGRIDAPRKPARHADDSNRSHTCVAQGRIPAFPCSAQAGNPAPSHLATLDLRNQNPRQSPIREATYFISDFPLLDPVLARPRKTHEAPASVGFAWIGQGCVTISSTHDMPRRAGAKPR